MTNSEINNSSDRQELLFIDDEPFFVKDYRRELSEDYRVWYFYTIDDGIDFLTNYPNRIAIIILDLLMPSSTNQDISPKDRSDFAGLALLNANLEKILTEKTPIVLLSNLSKTEIIDYINSNANLSKLINNIHFLNKTKTPPSELVKTVQSILKNRS